MGTPLLVRTARGAILSDEGAKVIPKLEALLASARALTDDGTEHQRKLTVAAPSFLLSSFMAAVAGALPHTRARALEVSAAFMRAYATENCFDLAMTIGPEKIAGAWTSRCVGTIRRALFASPTLARALGPRPSLAQIVRTRFVMPVYSNAGQFVPGEDGCPIPRSERLVGHESSTIAVGLELASNSDQLVFGPMIAARPWLDSGRLVAIHIEGWPVTDDLYLHANEDRILAREEKAIASALQTATRYFAAA